MIQIADELKEYEAVSYHQYHCNSSILDHKEKNMEKRKVRIVCVHGYKGKAENLTYRRLKRLIPSVDIIAEEYDLTDGTAVMKRIEELKPDILSGNSLGAFYAMAYEGNCKRILINPCLVPSVEIPKLDTFVSADAVGYWIELEKRVLVPRYTNTFGIFAKDDELFRFKKLFDTLCGDANHSILVEGTHILKDPGLTEGLSIAVCRLGIQKAI